VHVEDEGRGHVALHQTGQHHACQEALARARRAEDAAAALDEALQVKADGVALFDGVADDEVGPPFLAEDGGHVGGVGRARRRVVGGHGLDRLWPGVLLAAVDTRLPLGPLRRGQLRPQVEHQCRVDGQRGVERLAVEGAAHDRRQPVGLLVGEARVGRAQLQVGDEAVVAVAAALADDEAAFLDSVGRNGQADAEPFLQAAADDVAEGRGRGG